MQPKPLDTQFTYKEINYNKCTQECTVLHNMGAHLGFQKEEGENH